MVKEGGEDQYPDEQSVCQIRGDSHRKSDYGGQSQLHAEGLRIVLVKGDPCFQGTGSATGGTVSGVGGNYSF